jgi:hypothetical protein
MDEDLAHELKLTIKASYLLSLTRWHVRDKSRLPLEYLIRMEQGFVEGYALINEADVTLEYLRRLVVFHRRMQSLQNEFAHLF